VSAVAQSPLRVARGLLGRHAVCGEPLLLHGEVKRELVIEIAIEAAMADRGREPRREGSQPPPERHGLCRLHDAGHGDRDSVPFRRFAIELAPP
jgi:hypothetical protein